MLSKDKEEETSVWFYLCVIVLGLAVIILLKQDFATRCHAAGGHIVSAGRASICLDAYDKLIRDPDGQPNAL